MAYKQCIRVAFLFVFLLCNGDSVAEVFAAKSIPKTIQNKFGQIIDCIDLYSQPSLLLPSLKNHTIQMQPSSRPHNVDSDNVTSFSNSIVKISDIDCPSGTVPILRSNNGSTSGRPFYKITGHLSDQNDVRSGGHIAAVATRSSTFYYSESAISVWEPDLGPGPANPPRFTGAVATMHNGRDSELSGVYAGWFVDPHLYGDKHAHFEIGWNNGHKTCTNLGCAGFVQVSTNTFPGAIMQPVSVIYGTQYEIIVTIFKDASAGNWCLMFADEFVGYWPKQLFTRMRGAASVAGWVGVAAAAAAPGETYPPMGSGQGPDAGDGKAAYFRHARVVDGSRKLLVPDLTQIFMQTTDASCYDVSRPDTPGEGMQFYFGGAGCPPAA